MRQSIKKISTLTIHQLKRIIKTTGLFFMIVGLPILYLGMFYLSSRNESGRIEDFRVMFLIMGAMFSLALMPTLIATIISEEKAEHTLRVLMLSSVSAGEYVIALVAAGVGVNALCMTVYFQILGASLLNISTLLCLLALILALIVSALIGAVLGIFCKDRMSVGSYSMMIMVLIAVGPVIQVFFPSFNWLSMIFYPTHLLNILLHVFMENQLNLGFIFGRLTILLVNISIFSYIFKLIYQKNQWDD